MCMGCGATLIETSDGKNADSLENIFWLAAFLLWLLALNHVKFRFHSDNAKG